LALKPGVDGKPARECHSPVMHAQYTATATDFSSTKSCDSNWSTQVKISRIRNNNHFTIQKYTFGKTARKETSKNRQKPAKTKQQAKSHKKQTSKKKCTAPISKKVCTQATASDEKVDEVVQTPNQSKNSTF